MTAPEVATEGSMRLADGRRLGWLEVGDPSGAPVLHHHGGLSSALDVVGADDAARRAGVRVVAPDRPGIRGSDRRPGRTLLDWAADAGQLADHLGLDRFGVLGWSVGGMFAQAVARRLADRTTALVLVGCPIPVDWPGMLAELNQMDRRFTVASRSAAGRAAERAAIRGMSWTASAAPRGFGRAGGVPEALRREVAGAVAAGTANPAAVVDEYRILGSPWGFDPSDLRVPTTVWQGDADDLVPASWGDRLHRAIPGSRLRTVAGGTHYLAADHWDELLAGACWDGGRPA